MTPKRFMQLGIGAAGVLLATALPAAAAKPAPDVKGSIALAPTVASSAPMKYGDQVSFSTTVSGSTAKGTVYVTVVCSQGGKVVYQWSADPSFAFPLVQQDGLKALGYIFDETQSASCSGNLVYREENGKNITILYLAAVSFATEATVVQ